MAENRSKFWNELFSWALRGLLLYFCVQINQKMDRVDQLILENATLKIRLDATEKLSTQLQLGLVNNSEEDRKSHSEFRDKLDAVRTDIDYLKYTKANK